jgi:hypothetical protein
MGSSRLVLRSEAPQNAGHQARREAGARDERTLYAVACMPLFGAVASQ